MTHPPFTDPFKGTIFSEEGLRAMRSWFLAEKAWEIFPGATIIAQRVANAEDYWWPWSELWDEFSA